MVKIIQENNKTHYQCEACGFLYQDKEIAQKCEDWCREKKSCNLEIIKQGIMPEKLNEV